MSTEVTEARQSALSAIRYAAGTDIGRRREENQDSFGVIENNHFKLYIVADGMGGVKGGAIASNLAIQVVSAGLKEKSELTVTEVRDAVRGANAQIFEKGGEDTALTGMGTTLVGIGFVGASLIITNVGDSRLYRVRNKRIRQLSEDHTLVRELLKSGAITPDQADNHPVAHMLTRSLGPTPEVEVDCWVCDDGPARGDLYLLCSDGLYNLVSDRDMLEILNGNDLNGAIQKCIDLANERGGTDNITVIIVEVGEGFPIAADEFPEDPHSLGIDDTVELYPSPPESNGVHLNGSAEKHEQLDEPEAAAADSDQQPESPKIQPGVTFQHISDEASKASEADRAEVEPSAAIGSSNKDFRKTRYSISSTYAALLILGAGIVIGMLGGWLFTPASQQLGENDPLAHVQVLRDTAGVVSAPRRSDTEVAKLEVLLPVSLGNNQVQSALPEIDPYTGEDPLAPIFDDAIGDQLNGLSRHEAENIIVRKRELKDFISGLAEKLSALEKPLSGGLAEQLKAAQRERDELKARFESVQVDIDAQARKLAVWYGRQKRLQSTDPINLAGEVAVTTSSVKDKKEIFERATWAYLQEAEVLRYNPTDTAQDQKVKNLMKVRKQRMSELSREVQTAIEAEVRATDSKIAELTLERDRVQNQLTGKSQELEYIQIIMGGDARTKDKVREELTQKKAAAESELEELNQLLPQRSQY
ncbi:MAG: Stp1/IreP family PP2C-type Ser/Thr phosphatase [Oligoflexia bacterium]|nr:Stp1/IreP family PP2C-type Ser/Thr phosphatase [Oligoflexia bacterium]